MSKESSYRYRYRNIYMQLQLGLGEHNQFLNELHKSSRGPIMVIDNLSIFIYMLIDS